MAIEGSSCQLCPKRCLLLPKSIRVSVDTAPTGIAGASSARELISASTPDLEETTRDMDQASVRRRHHRVGPRLCLAGARVIGRMTDRTRLESARLRERRFEPRLEGARRELSPRADPASVDRPMADGTREPRVRPG